MELKQRCLEMEFIMKELLKKFKKVQKASEALGENYKNVGLINKSFILESLKDLS